LPYGIFSPRKLEVKQVEVRKAVIITKQRQRLREKHFELTLTDTHAQKFVKNFKNVTNNGQKATPWWL